MAMLVVKKDAWIGADAGVLEPLSGALFPLTKDETVIGRRPPADIVLPASNISSTEVKIVRESDNYFLEDIRSSNGTRFKDQRMQYSPRQLLSPGDEIQVGEYLLVFLLGDEPLQVT